MGYVVRHSTSNINKARRKGNVALGVSSEGYDKTSVSGFYAGVEPVEGKHNLVRTSASDDPDFYALTDTELINFANQLGGSVSDTLAAKNYLLQQDNVIFLDELPGNTETDGLVVDLNAGIEASFLDNKPTVNLLEQSGASSLPNRTDIYNRAGKTNLGNGKYKFVNHGGGSSTIRLYCNLNDLEDGETYTYSISYEEFDGGDGSSLTLDWCDTGNQSFSGASGRASATSFRSTYNSTYRFFDISIPTNASIILFDAQVEKGNEATPYVNGTRSQNTTWYDLSGNGYNATLYNSPSFSNGKFVLDNTNDYILASFDGGVLKQSNQFGTWTIETSFIYNGNSSNNEAIIAGRSGHHGGIYMYNNDILRHAIKTDQGWTGAVNTAIATLQDGRGYHTVMTYNDGTVKSYLNGEYISTSTLDLDTYDMRTYDNTFYIGGINTRYNDISLEKVKCYSKELSQSEISQNYYGGDIVTSSLQLSVDAGNLVSYESGSTTSYDMVSGDEGDGYGSYDTDGTLTNGVLFHSGSGGSWHFDGANDYISFGNQAFQYQYDDAFSLEVWCNPDAVSGFKHLIGVTYASYRLAHAGTSLSFRLDANNLIAAGGTLEVGKWTHVVATYNPTTKTAKVYQNGVQVSSVTDSTADWTSQGTDFRLASSPGENYYFDGKIAIGRVYNKTLSAGEVLQNYNAHKTRFL